MVSFLGGLSRFFESKNKKDIRLRSSIYINHKNLNFIIDTGPDFRQQILNNKKCPVQFLFVVILFQIAIQNKGLDSFSMEDPSY